MALLPPNDVMLELTIHRVGCALQSAQRVQDDSTIVLLAMVKSLFMSSINFRAQRTLLDDYVRQSVDVLVMTEGYEQAPGAAFHAISAYGWMVDWIVGDESALAIVEQYLTALERVIGIITNRT